MNKFNSFLLSFLISFVSFGFAMEHRADNTTSPAPESSKKSKEEDVTVYYYLTGDNDYKEIHITDNGIEVEESEKDLLGKDFPLFGFAEGEGYKKIGHFNHLTKKVVFSKAGSSSGHKSSDSCFVCTSQNALITVGVGLFVVLGGWLFKNWYDKNNEKNTNTKTLEE